MVYDYVEKIKLISGDENSITQKLDYKFINGSTKGKIKIDYLDYCWFNNYFRILSSSK